MATPKSTAGAVQVLDAKSPGARYFELQPADTEAAASIGVVLAGSRDDRVARLVQTQNAAARLAVEAGYLLLSIKAESSHGDFLTGLDAIGLSQQRAGELMRMAKFVTQLAADQRAQLLKLNKTKLLALSTADAESVQALLEDGKTDIEALSSRELAKKLGDERVRRMKAEQDAEYLRKRLLRATSGVGTEVPPLVAEIRSRIALLSQQVVGAAEGMREVHAALIALLGNKEGGTWVDPTLRVGVAACAHMHTQALGLLSLFTRDLPEGDYGPVPQSHFLDGELEALAGKFTELIGTQRLLASQHVVRSANASRTGPGRHAKVPTAAPPQRKGRRT